MSGLIPLRLQPDVAGICGPAPRPSSHSSFTASDTITTTNRRSIQRSGSLSRPHQRHQSRPNINPKQSLTWASPRCSNANQLPLYLKLVTSSGDQKEKMWRRFSHLPPGTHVVVPNTKAEWRTTMAEIKKHHAEGRFRICSATCCEILDSLRTNPDVEAQYLIFLHFYAASALESAARPLVTTSPLKVKLLEQSRDHYTSAANLLNVTGGTSSGFAPSFNFPFGARASVSSRYSTSSARSSTPTTEYPPTAAVSMATTPGPRRHRVSTFFGPPGPPPVVAAPSPPVKQKVIPVPREPIFRPDSPTLGLESFGSIGSTASQLPPLPSFRPQQRVDPTGGVRPVLDLDIHSATPRLPYEPHYHHSARTASVSSCASTASSICSSALTSALSSVASSPDSYTSSCSKYQNPKTHPQPHHQQVNQQQLGHSLEHSCVRADPTDTPAPAPAPTLQQLHQQLSPFTYSPAKVSSTTTTPSQASRTSQGTRPMLNPVLLEGLSAQIGYHIAMVETELASCTHSTTYDATRRPSSALSIATTSEAAPPPPSLRGGTYVLLALREEREKVKQREREREVEMERRRELEKQEERDTEKEVMEPTTGQDNAAPGPMK